MDLPKYKIQLHSHLDSCVRHETIWELTHGDRDALERVAYEAGVDQASEGVLYSEMLLSPHMLAASSTALRWPGMPETMASARDVVDAALQGLRRAEQETGAKLRIVLCCLRGMPEGSPEVLELCREYSSQGVVGIDVCGVIRPGDVSTAPAFSDAGEYGEEVTHPLIVETFQRALFCGVHRTVHAAEAGPPATMLRAVRQLHAERIGHGYRAVAEGGDAYRTALAAGVHFECCPTSSYLTGGVDRDTKEHPILRLRRDGASFSLNTDNPTVTHTKLEDEYRLALELGFTPEDLLRCNRSAISASFLPDDEKWELLRKYDRLTSAETATE
ncbi:adenosine deaminase-like isoform X2 [Amblyomma americanum]